MLYGCSPDFSLSSSSSSVSVTKILPATPVAPRLQEAVLPTTLSSLVFQEPHLTEAVMLAALLDNRTPLQRLLLLLLLLCHQLPLLLPLVVLQASATIRTQHKRPFETLPTWFHVRTAVHVETTSAVLATIASAGQCHSLFQAHRIVCKR